MKEKSLEIAHVYIDSYDKRWHCSGEKMSLSINGAGSTEHPYRKRMNLGSYVIPYIKIKSR